MINNNQMNSASSIRTKIPSPFKTNSSLPSAMQSKVNYMTKSGAADEELFTNSFENVNRIQITSGKDLEQELVKIKDVCADMNIDWEKRIESLKRFRALLLAGATDHEELYSSLKLLELSFQISLKDLRSQVVREACITVAYLSTRIGIKCDRFIEALLPTMINLIQNSAKIMSSSANVAIRFIIQHTKSGRLIPIITENITSKSKEIRKACCEFLNQLLHSWPVSCLEKHVGILQEAIKKGISDADPEARAFSRKAYWVFADKFSHEAQVLLHSLDMNKQKMIKDEQLTQTNNNYSANFNLVKRTKVTGSNGSIDQKDYARPATTVSRTNFGSSTKSGSSSRPTILSMRASSAIDAEAQRRAKARANYGALVQQKINKIALTRPPQKLSNEATTRLTERMSRLRTRTSQSQPGSRSVSPSSKLNYINMNPTIQTQYSAGNFNGRTSPTLNKRKLVINGLHQNSINNEVDVGNRRSSASSHELSTILIRLKTNLSDVESRNEVLNDLIEVIRESPASLDLKAEKDFKEIYKLLLDKIANEPDGNVKVLALRTICDLLVKYPNSFKEFIEVTIYLLLNKSKDSDKQVVRASEVYAATATSVLPPEICLKVLKPIIINDQAPVNIAAIKMLNKLIEQLPKQKVKELIPEMMPTLIQAWNHDESAVRKAVVFCLVAINRVDREHMEPFLKSVKPNQLKLLNVYIEKDKN